MENGFKKHDENLIQVVQPQSDIYSVIREFTRRKSHQKDPFYICNINELIRRHEDWKGAMPRIEPYYAVKCNSSQMVLETLAALGTGFDCASEGEIKNILSLGVHPNRIIFANPTKKISHLEYAVAAGVHKMTFDNEYELHKIKKVHPGAKLLIRIRYDDLSARFTFGVKYGCNHDEEALELLQVASALDLDVIGVCFHIGSNSTDWSIYEKAIAAARHVFDIAETVGYEFEMVDIGGGFPGEKNRCIREIARIINPALEKYFPDPSIKIISEPGRYYVTSAFTLVSTIHSIKNVVQVDPATKKKTKIRMYYVDVSVYGGLISVFFEEYFKIKPLRDDPNTEIRPSIVWGPTLDPYDKLSEGVVMLPHMEAGDRVVFEEAGAYSMAIACEFNGFPTPKIYSVVDEDGWLLLSEKVPYPLPRGTFLKGNNLKHFKIDLNSK